MTCFPFGALFYKCDISLEKNECSFHNNPGGNDSSYHFYNSEQRSIAGKVPVLVLYNVPIGFGPFGLCFWRDYWMDFPGVV
jgi:hypothetical protein